ncbi:3-ketoacyl-ACP reductase [Paralcaligenes ureilyticus]|uniref:NAD(P)-dependent dehydrogenase (Short-subunit alcohol dehydrogenase family) n=1 Tax=Paralcaligenes ureilyticus TaxID=627131 RepID=A0A4R3LV85_9BURK|nr:3-ketoacyl-ACP reductase [Paralcaligenes ureilyticus]TCT04471.1 NAD(P)-dependent dehydrogenase (short-subunit alcohol dehydrogenase family) [Paralcaligenes ureilyticus]
MDKASQDRRVAIVTGGRRGIGRAIVYQLAQAGFDLVLNDVVADPALDETLKGADARGARVEFVLADISDVAGHGTLVDAAYERFGRLDALVNNAGVQVRMRGDLLDVTPERFDEIIGINLRGNFFLTQHVSQRMLADGQPTAGRSIVIVSSSNAELVSIEKGEYCVSKIGLSMTAKLFAVRLAEAGIAVFEIRPGLIRTDMTAEVRDKYGLLIEQGISPIRRWGEPEDVGRAVATLVCGLIPFATGIAVDIDGGLLIPRL